MTSRFCSAQNWRYAAKRFVKAYPSEVLVHCELYIRFSSRLSFSFKLYSTLCSRVDHMLTLSSNEILVLEKLAGCGLVWTSKVN